MATRRMGILQMTDKKRLIFPNRLLGRNFHQRFYSQNLTRTGVFLSISCAVISQSCRFSDH
jgi:hypothetical protein